MAAGKPIGTLFVPIKAKTDKYKKGLAGAENRTKRFEKSISSNLLKMGAAFISFGAVTAGVFKVISDASDLEEVTSKFDTVFAGQEAQAEQWSKTLVDAYAMSTREAKRYLSGVQDLLVPMGMQSQAAGKMSNEIVKLAADLGSFNNLETADVIRDMESALTGEYQTMKKYGIVLNATTIQQRALQMGLADTKKELTAGMKAQAAYAMMIDGSTAAIGDMEKTAGSYANQVKKLKSQIEDMSAAIGNELLPMATEVVKSMNEIAEANKDIIGDRFVSAMNVALVGMQAFHNAWLGVKLVGQSAVAAIAFSIDDLFLTMKQHGALIAPNIIGEALKKLGIVKDNPLSEISDSLARLKDTSLEVGSQIVEDTIKINARYETWAAKLNEVAEKEKAVANTVVQAEKDKVAAVAMTEQEKAKIRNKYADEYMEGLGLQYEFDRMMLDQRKAEMIAAGYEEKLVIDSLAEKYRELEEQKVLDSGTFFEGVSVGMAQLYDETMTYAELGAETTKTLFTGVTKGIGKSVAQAIMSGQSMAKSMKAVMKSVAASIIENLITVGVQRMLLNALNIGATASEHVTASAAAASETYANSFKSAAAIPVVGWAMAPGVAATNLAAVLTGMAAASKAGAGVAALHGGSDYVPKESTYLLDKGERVLSPRQNEDLTDFMGSGGGQNITFNISAIDSEGMAEVVREKVIPALQDALELNSGDFADSILEVA